MPEHALGDFPAQAGVGDADTVLQVLRVLQFLSAFGQVALDHNADERLAAIGWLGDEVDPHVFLTGMLLARIGMAAIDHGDFGQFGGLQLGGGFGDGSRVEIGAGSSSPQDDMAVVIAGGPDHRGDSFLIHAQKMMRVSGRQHGVDDDLQGTVGAVLEAHGHGKTAGHFAMGLALGGSCADGGPADQVCQILRHHGIQEFSGGRETQVVHRQEKSPSDSQAGIDIISAVQLGTTSEPVPDREIPARTNPSVDQPTGWELTRGAINCKLFALI